MNVQNSVVPALERALNIIEYIAAHSEPVTLKQITTDLCIPSASAFRLIKNLVSRGYVSENSGAHMTYSLGSKFMSIASAYERNSSLHLAAKPVMLSLASQLGQTVQLGIWKNGVLIYIDQAFSSAPLSVTAPLYEPVSINTSASAKITLPLLPEEERTNAIDACDFRRLTDNTITDKTVFMEEVRKSHEQATDLTTKNLQLESAAWQFQSMIMSKTVSALSESPALFRHTRKKTCFNICSLSCVKLLPE